MSKKKPLIEKLEAEVEIAHAAYRVAKEKLFRARSEAMPFKVGDVVIERGKEYLVVRITNPEWGWAKGNPRKKDGSWGKAVVNLFHPELQ